jgi:hypothetical protein
MTRKATATKLNNYARGQEIRYLVHNAAGRQIGLLTKIRDSKYERHPWKAFLLDANTSRSKPNTMVAALYGANAKQLAIDAIVEATS